MSEFGTLSTTPESVRVNGKPLDLTAYEFRILSLLVTNQATREHDITPHAHLEMVAPAPAVSSETPHSNVTQVLVSRLRRKLRDAGANMTIKVVRGIGYKLVEVGDA